MTRRALVPAAALLVLSLLAASLARGTPYWGPDEVAGRAADGARSAPESEVLRSAAARALSAAAARGELRDTDYLAVFGLIAEFLSVWQVNRPGDPNHGGIREGEHLPDIIQTDNTSEAIWVWSRYYELTGDDQYFDNIIRAFAYSLLHPAYAEEGGSLPSTGYYRMYNCGWAACAELKFRQVYGDDTYLAYGDACGDYIRDHYLDMSGPMFNDRVNPPVLSWAAGNLYIRGLFDDNASWREGALAHARDRVKPWVEAAPSILAIEEWAMSGGATMWGLLASYFAEYPGEAAAWLALYKDEMDLTATPGQFTNAWNGWYALGHRAVGEALDDPFHLGVHLSLTEELVLEDGDNDGGIPARPEDNDDQDQTWVSNYLAFMGLSPLLPGGAGAPPLAQREGPRLEIGPNPAPGRTALGFRMAGPGDAAVEIIDASGRLVAALRRGPAAAGAHSVRWTGADDSGSPVPAGVYFALLRTASGRSVQRVALVR
ncbi:MAG: hypothetical protein FJY75_06150 [Candidatus Eisenbacteria bacterium]|uniref:FlgD/Vpr Ig-like domain-containing protein n=1 Tax=Eiseniibacteriota bacterium TaxID=2212470 RepID=A0A938BQP7_UNCEI|nr:hypothetical protein [Candidatus Eisenbacteria bacterium]